MAEILSEVSAHCCPEQKGRSPVGYQSELHCRFAQRFCCCTRLPVKSAAQNSFSCIHIHCPVSGFLGGRARSPGCLNPNQTINSLSSSCWFNEHAAKIHWLIWFSFLPLHKNGEEGSLYAISPRGVQARLSVRTDLLVAALAQEGWHIDILIGGIRIILNMRLRLRRGFLPPGELGRRYLLLFSGG